jgi:Flp pilus assembly protein TadG
VTNNTLSRTKGNRERGSVIVELAVTMPIFALLLAGMLQIGLIARDYQVLLNGAREGARLSALPANQIALAQDPAAALSIIQNRVIAYLASENITVTASNITVDQAYPITIGSLSVMGSHVTISFSRSLLTPGLTSLLPSLSSLTLTADAVFRNFY